MVGKTPEAARYYNRPSWFRVKVYDPLVRRTVELTGWTGFGGEDAHRVLAVRGRKTGRWYERLVSVCTVGGDRYIVSFYGESYWARNLRAGVEAELRLGEKAEPILATELRGEEKAAFLKTLARRYAWIVRIWWKVRAPELRPEDLALLIERYPVFRISAKPKFTD